MSHNLDLFADPPENPKKRATISGRTLRDEGMLRAADHADRVAENWQERAYSLFCDFARSGVEFMTEDVWQRAEALGSVGKPPDRRAWGSVATRALKAGMVRRVRFDKVKTPRNHCGPRSVWRGTPTP